MESDLIKIAWWGKYFWEEPVLVGNKKQGTGAIFFSGCNMHCAFCQNYQISQEGMGKWYSVDDLENILLDLQKQGVVSIDLVTPTIWHQQIKKAIIKAKEKGLKIPTVWNSNAYESQEAIQQLKGIVDIYLPDFKYGDDKLAQKYSKVSNYSSIAFRAIKEMFSQVGLLQIKNGIAQKGVIIRHLILPSNVNNSLLALDKLREIDKDLTISLMSQYVPVYQAYKYPEINRPVNQREKERVYNYFKKLGFHNGWIQLEPEDDLLPDFTKKNPFSRLNS